MTYFVNPNFPGLLNDVGECSLRVKKISKDISQVRLDFVNFNLVSVCRGEDSSRRPDPTSFFCRNLNRTRRFCFAGAAQQEDGSVRDRHVRRHRRSVERPEDLRSEQRPTRYVRTTDPSRRRARAFLRGTGGGLQYCPDM